MSSLHRKTSSSQRTVGASSGYDGMNDYNGNSSTHANTLANRRPSVDHNRVLANGKKQRPITSYSTLLPPPSPTYFRLQEMGASKGAGQQNGGGADSARYSQYLQQHQQPGELDHLKPLDARAVQTGEPEAPTSWHQRVSIWMINEGTVHLSWR